MTPPDIAALVTVIATADDAVMGMFMSIGAMIVASLVLIIAMVLLSIGINHDEEETVIRRRWYGIAPGMVLIAFMLYGWGTAWNRDRTANRVVAAATLCPRIVPALPRLTLPQYEAIIGLCRRDERVIASPVLDAACMDVMLDRTTPFTPLFMRQIEEICGRTAVDTFVLNQSRRIAPGNAVRADHADVVLARPPSPDN